MKYNLGRSFLLCLCFLFFFTTAHAYTLSGIVYGGSDPLPDTQVLLIDPDSADQLGESVTGIDGNYTFSVDNGTYDLAVIPPVDSGFASSPVAGILVSDQDVIQNIVLISGARTITGTVRMPDGTPASNIRLRFKDQTSNALIADAASDTDGTYSVPLADGTYKIDVENVDGMISSAPVPQQFRIRPLVSGLEVSGDTTMDLTLPIAAMSGFTTDSNGDPVGGVSVSVGEYYWIDDTPLGIVSYKWIVHTSISDDTGAYFLPLIVGKNHAITLTPPSGSDFATTIVSIQVDADMTRDLALGSASTLQGTVQVPDGTPAGNIQLKFNNQVSDVLVASVVTDADGSYSVTLSDGIYEIDVGHAQETWPTALTPTLWGICPLLSGLEVNGDATLDITLPIPVMSGFTTDSNGDPVGGVSITVEKNWWDNSSGILTYHWLHHTSISDDTGAYSLPLLAGGDYVVILTPPSESDFAITVVPDIQADADITKDLVLASASILQGTVRVPDGTPASKVWLKFKEQTSDAMVASFLSDEDGGYSVPLADGTTYKIEVEDLDGITSIPSAPECFYIRPLMYGLEVSEDTTLDLTLPFAFISGFTTDSNGVSVGGVSVGVGEEYPWIVRDLISGLLTYYSIHATTSISDDTGAYSLPLIAGGNYAISIIPPEGSGFAQTVVNDVLVENDMLQNIILTMPDTVAPMILSGPTASHITETTAVVEWQTNEIASGELRYGLTSPPSTVITETTPVTHHSQVLTGLNPDTRYFLQVTASDPSENGPVESDMVSFRTLPTPDSEAPAIIEGPVVTAITQNSAVITWCTDEPSNGILTYGLDENFGSSVQSTLSARHEVVLNGLSEQTRYFFQVSASDNLNNGPTLSAVLDFTTIGSLDLTAPIILEGPMILNISDTGATVFWTTDEPATSGVSYNDGTAYGVYQDDAFVTEHTVRLTELSPSTLYELTVSSQDKGGNGPALGGPSSFTTLSSADTSFPVITVSPLVINITHQSALIRWKTDEPADGVIRYGLAADQLTEIASHAALTKPHNMPLTGLEAGTQYFFQVLSIDAYNNGPTASDIYTFTTDPEPNEKHLELTMSPEVIYSDDDLVTIAWKTDVPSDSVVEYTAPNGETKRSSNGKKVQKHQVTLAGLEPGTEYDIAVSSADSDGNILVAELNKRSVMIASSGSGWFDLLSPVTTESVADTTAPLITEGPEVVGMSDASITLRWVTNEIADSLVSYGVQGQDMLQNTGEIKDVSEHILTLTNLTPNTIYNYQVASIDAAGNGPTMSSVLEFTTGSVPDDSAPTFLFQPQTTTLYEDKAFIVWATNEAATSALYYGTDPDSMGSQYAITGLRLEHTIVLTNLDPGTTYYCQAVSTDSSGNASISDYVSFTTMGTPSEDADHDGVADVNDQCPDHDDGVDTDSDGLPDGCDEYPEDPAASIDTDGDGYPDAWNEGKTEADSTAGLSLDAFPDDSSEWLDTDEDDTGNNADTDDDNDGLSDEDENTLGTDPLDDDSDDDGLTDGEEVNTYSTDPLDPDSDGDGFNDGVEVLNSTNPNDLNDHPNRAMPWIQLLLLDN